MGRKGRRMGSLEGWTAPMQPGAGPSPFEGRYAATSSDNRFAVARG